MRLYKKSLLLFGLTVFSFFIISTIVGYQNGDVRPALSDSVPEDGCVWFDFEGNFTAVDCEVAFAED